MGKNNNNGLCPRTCTRKNLAFIQRNMNIRFCTGVPKETGFVYMWSCPLSSSRASLSLSLCLSLSSPLFQYSLLSLYTSTFLTSSSSISTSPPSSFDTCYFSHLKQVVEGTYLAVTCTIQVTFSSMRLIKLLSTI